MWTFKFDHHHFPPLGNYLENQNGLVIQIMQGWEGKHNEATEKLMKDLNQKEEDAWKYRELNK